MSITDSPIPTNRSLPWIVVVEDEPSSARLILRAFERLEIQNRVVLVKNAEAAWDTLEKPLADSDPPHPGPGLIITDHRLPRISGLELVRWVRQSPVHQEVPCVVFSACGNPEDVVEAYQAGANCFIVKPYRFVELRELMHSIHHFFLPHGVSQGALP